MGRQKADEPPHIHQSTLLRDRGWTASLVRRHLGEPDKLAVNQHYRSGPKAKLYRLDRVEAAEKTPEFQEAFSRLRTGAQNRREAARKAVETKRNSLLEAVGKIKVTVPVLDQKTITKEAIDHYNARLSDRESDLCGAGRDSDSAFLNRITVNYIRHQLTDYDVELDALSGAVGKDEAGSLIRERVLDAIAEAYPWLEGECIRQL